MADRLTDTEMAAWQALLHAHYDVTRVLDGELREQHGLTWSEYDALVRLARAEGRRLPMAELARRVMLSQSGLTRAVDSLARKRLVVRERGAADGRMVIAVLAAKGLELVRRASATHLRGIRRHFTGRLTEAQLRAVANALGVITGPHQPH